MGRTQRIVLLSLLLLAGCATPVRPEAARTDLPACADPRPAATRSISGPEAPVVSGQRFGRTWVLDHGGLRVDPPGDRKPGVPYALARCTLLSARTAENFGVLQQAEQQGFTLALGVVTVRPGVAAGVLDSIADVPYSPPAVLPRHRLAWIAVTHPAVVSACPAIAGPMEPRPRPDPTATGYQVLILDAASGSDGALYVARSAQVCFPGVQAASFGRLRQEVSLPWRLVGRDAHTATLRVTPHRCDGVGYADVAAGAVIARVTRTIAGCTAGRPTRIRLTKGIGLPRTLRHAPVGAWDAPDS